MTGKETETDSVSSMFGNRIPLFDSSFLMIEINERPKFSIISHKKLKRIFVYNEKLFLNFIKNTFFFGTAISMLLNL